MRHTLLRREYIIWDLSPQQASRLVSRVVDALGTDKRLRTSKWEVGQATKGIGRSAIVTISKLGAMGRVPRPTKRQLEALGEVVRSAWSADKGGGKRSNPAGRELGELVAVEYDGVIDGDDAIWRHEFETGARPRLETDARGRLRVNGGSYEVTARGIEDV